MNSAQNSREHNGDKIKGEESNSSAPPYGSKAYWEQRYASHYNDNGSNKRQKAENELWVTGDAEAICEKEEAEDEDPDPLPGHAWYFTYEELQPLLLPLILGKGDDEAESDLGSESEDKDDGDKGKKTKDAKGIDASQKGSNDDEKSSLKLDQRMTSEKKMVTPDADAGPAEFSVMQNKTSLPTESKHQRPSDKPGKGPKSVLEIGCGDVPLGTDLFKDLVRLQRSTGSRTECLFQRIVCCDYSETVIQTMNESKSTLLEEVGVAGASVVLSSSGQAISSSSKETSAADDEEDPHDAGITRGSPKIVFEVADARDMAYSDGEFDLILDKGTLDAMLSDKVVGISNCVQIVTECARVLGIDGYMMVVSHLNAHNTSGLEWLDEVVVPGLRSGGGSAGWEIEVHGSHGNEHADGDEEEDDVEVLLGGGKKSDSVNSGATGGYKDLSDGDNGPYQSNSDDKKRKKENFKEDTESLGPAVYIIHKTFPKQAQNESHDPRAEATSNMPTIPLKFFTY